MNDKNEKKSQDKIDKLKSELYSRKTGNIKPKRSRLKKDRVEYKNYWGQKEEKKNPNNSADLYKFKKRGPNIFFIIFFISLIFFVAAASFAFFSFFFDKNEVQGEIKMAIVGPNSISSGEVLDFSIKIENPTRLDYKKILINIEYPESTIDANEEIFTKYKTISLPEDLLSGGSIEKRFSVVLSGVIGEKKEIDINVSYKAGSFSNTLYLKKIYKINIDSAPVTIQIEKPESILSKKDFSFDIEVLSNTNSELENLVVVAKYPRGFILKETQPNPVFSSSGQSIFKIKQLEVGEGKKINIKGSLEGLDDEDKYFHFSVGDSEISKNEIRTLFSESESIISIKRPDVEFVLSSETLRREGFWVVKPGKVIDFKMLATNNLDSTISDVVITSEFNKELIDSRNVDVAKGFYDSNNNKIIWNRSSDKFLGVVEKNKKFREDFSLKIKDLEDVAGYFKDPEIVLDFEVNAVGFGSTEIDGKINEKFQEKIRVPTVVELQTEILYEGGPFKNTGKFSPKVGEPTTYTVAWKISNSSSQISDVEVSAKLPPYVKYLNNVYPKNSYISYKEDTREVNLKFKTIDEFIGHRTDPKTVYFQVEFTPTDSMVGDVPIIVERKFFKAKDLFTESEILLTVEEKKLTENPKTEGNGKGQVQE